MPRTKNLFGSIELRDTLALASIIGILPQQVVKEALESTGSLDIRHRTLPKYFVVYLVIFLCVYKDKATDEVLRHLFEGLDTLYENKSVLRASDAAISKARKRVGEKPFQRLFTMYCTPMCDANDKYAYYKGLHKFALDASEFYLQCTQDVLGKFPTSESDGKNPQNCSKIKFGALMEIGSHAYIDVAYGNVANSEQDFADVLIGRLGSGKLLLGDRYYRSVLNILRVKSQGSEALFRATSNMLLTPVKRLYDGSYLASIQAGRSCKSDRRHSDNFRNDAENFKRVTVRVIPFEIRKAETGEVVDRGRLITTLLAPRKYRAQELIDIYTERWEEEMGFDEIKAHLMKGAQDSLRSKTAELVKQEFWAMFIAHYLLRRIIYEASDLAGQMPNKIGFVGVRDLFQRKTTAKSFFPS